jgi:hypothetical protein
MKLGIAAGALALFLASGEASAFCIENGIPGRSVQASVVSLRARPPAQLWSKAVETGQQLCCNPQNALCSSDEPGNDGVVHFSARIEAIANLRATECGVFAKDPQERIVYAPARGYLRFEPNRAFNPRLPVNLVNAPFLVRVLDIARRPITDLPCL